jgi:hypothetical protein
MEHTMDNTSFTVMQRETRRLIMSVALLCGVGLATGMVVFGVLAYRGHHADSLHPPAAATTNAPPKSDAGATVGKGATEKEPIQR